MTGGVIRDLTDLRIFMEHHVYAVWDFMSLAKNIQHLIAPSNVGVWTPTAALQTFGRDINSMILAEESDEHGSHFDIYLNAMKEVGADTSQVNALIKLIQTTKTKSLNECLMTIPEECYDFCITTFGFLQEGAPHKIAAVFAYGRETAIPGMFKNLLVDLRATGAIEEAVTLEYYIERHIGLDGDEHGPAAVKLVEHFCSDDPVKHAEAETAAIEAIVARERFWTAIAGKIEKIRQIRQGWAR